MTPLQPTAQPLERFLFCGGEGKTESKTLMRAKLCQHQTTILFTFIVILFPNIFILVNLFVPFILLFLIAKHTLPLIYHILLHRWKHILQQPRLAQERLRVWPFSFPGKSATLEVIKDEHLMNHLSALLLDIQAGEYHMISISKLAPSDRATWEALFRAYIDFYQRVEPAEMYER